MGKYIEGWRQGATLLEIAHPQFRTREFPLGVSMLLQSYILKCHYRLSRFTATRAKSPVNVIEYLDNGVAVAHHGDQ